MKKSLTYLTVLLTSLLLAACGKDPQLEKAEELAWKMIDSRFMKNDGDTYTTLAIWEEMMGDKNMRIFQFKGLTLDVEEKELDKGDDLNGVTFKAKCKFDFDGIRSVSPRDGEWDDWSSPSNNNSAYILIEKRNGEMKVEFSHLEHSIWRLDIEDCRKSEDLKRLLEQL